MEVKKGYKQTEVVVIPEDWEVKTIGKLFSISGGFSSSRDQLSDEGFCYLHYGDIHKSNKTYINVEEEYPEIPKLKIDIKSISPKSLLNDGDVVFVDASEDDEGASKHVVIRNPQGIPYISGLHTIVIKSNDDSVVNLYKQFCFQTSNVKKQFKFYAVGTKVTGISKTNIANIQIALPPTKAEQTAIATSLSDTDTLINSLEKLIAKKRNIKRGVMQQLLTGKKRLPGFNGEWAVKRMGEVGFFSKGRGLSKDSINVSDGLPAIPYTAIYTDFSEVIDYSRIKHFTKSACETIIINTPHLLIASSSNMLENIGKATAFNNEFDVAVGGDIILYKTTANVCFLSYLLSTRPHRKRIVSLSQGSTIRHVYASTFDNYEIAFPSLPEQTAIAQVISDMDAEIKALEQKLAKYRFTKQGMMQELLTGKKRLI